MIEGCKDQLAAVHLKEYGDDDELLLDACPVFNFVAKLMASEGVNPL